MKTLEQQVSTWKPILQKCNPNLSDSDYEKLSNFCYVYNEKVTYEMNSTFLPTLLKIITTAISLFNENSIEYSFCNISEDNPDVDEVDGVFTFTKIQESKTHTISVSMTKDVYNSGNQIIFSKIHNILYEKCIDYLVRYGKENNNKVIFKVTGHELSTTNLDDRPTTNISLQLFDCI